MSICCHYDEGYGDGVAAVGESAVSDALLALAREYDRRGDWERAEFAREFSGVLAKRNVRALVEDERKYEVHLLTLYRSVTEAA